MEIRLVIDQWIFNGLAFYFISQAVGSSEKVSHSAVLMGVISSKKKKNCSHADTSPLPLDRYYILRISPVQETTEATNSCMFLYVRCIDHKTVFPTRYIRFIQHEILIIAGKCTVNHFVFFSLFQVITNNSAIDKNISIS